MQITLDQPYSVGDLAPDTTYPHVYITTFYVNGPARTATIAYEVGTLAGVSEGNPMGTWQKAPEVPGASVQLTGEQLYPFFGAKAVAAGDAASDGAKVPSPYLWDQVEAILYRIVQESDARLAGEIA